MVADLLRLFPPNINLGICFVLFGLLLQFIIIPLVQIPCDLLEKKFNRDLLPPKEYLASSARLLIILGSIILLLEILAKHFFYYQTLSGWITR